MGLTASINDIISREIGYSADMLDPNNYAESHIGYCEVCRDEVYENAESNGEMICAYCLDDMKYSVADDDECDDEE